MIIGISSAANYTIPIMTSLPTRPEVRPTTLSFQQWLQHGEMLYQSAMQEYHALEQQLDELERRLAAKQTELNQVATMMGKPPIEGTRRVAAQIVTPPVEEANRPVLTTSPNGNNIGGNNVGSTANNTNIARALAGKAVRQPV